MTQEIKTIDANISINGYKSIAIVAATFVGAYAVVKVVDKVFTSSVVINADNRKVDSK